MQSKKEEEIALFRFAVISPLLGIKRTQRGQREKLIKDLASAQWDIPYSSRSYICRSTILGWLKRYKNSSNQLSSLYPKTRQDKGEMRSMDKETQQELINFRKQNMDITVKDFLKLAQKQGVTLPDFKASTQSVYRLLQKNNLVDHPLEHKDLRSFEAQLPNDLWQSDCMHGPMVLENGKKRKTFLFAFIDDHSRLIPRAQFYLQENIDNYMDCLYTALSTRGMPAKLYLDNGPSFRSHRLKYTTASLGIVLLHAKPYCPQGKGKIERWFRTVRLKFLAPLKGQLMSIEQLNEKLQQYIKDNYHTAIHSSTGQSPFERFSCNLHLIRCAPQGLNDHFRIKHKRTVLKNRTVSLNGKLYEAPLGLIGKKIILLFTQHEPEKIEVFYKEKPYGFLQRLDKHVNCRVKRKGPLPEKTEQKNISNPDQPQQSGELF